MRSFFGITAHYVADWYLQSVMLACSRFHASHTGDAISEEFEKNNSLLSNIIESLFTITDSASNMLKVFSLPGFEEENDDDSEDENDDSEGEEVEKLEMPQELQELQDDIYSDLNQHIPCFAQVLQLVIKDGSNRLPASTRF